MPNVASINVGMGRSTTVMSIDDLAYIPISCPRMLYTGCRGECVLRWIVSATMVKEKMRKVV